MSRLAQRIGKLERMREERLRVIVICAPNWATGEPGTPRPMAVLGASRKLAEAEAATLLAPLPDHLHGGGARRLGLTQTAIRAQQDQARNVVELRPAIEGGHEHGQNTDSWRG